MPTYKVKYKVGTDIKSTTLSAQDESEAGKLFSSSNRSISVDDIISVKAQPYSYCSYEEVPFYRKQWFFWLMYFTLTPIALGLLVFGDVYYKSQGDVRSFGIANRVVAGLIATFWIFKLVKLFVLSQ